jgi:hypothetical protein
MSTYLSIEKITYIYSQVSGFNQFAGDQIFWHLIAESNIKKGNKYDHGEILEIKDDILSGVAPKKNGKKKK